MIRLLYLIAVALLLSSALPAAAQAPVPAPEASQDDLAAFRTAMGRLRTLTAPEQQIPAIEDALRRLSALEGRLPAENRDRIRGGLSGILGDAFYERRLGSRAENLEKAIAAYGVALTIYTRDGFPKIWAEFQSGLGKAYFARIRGERADNIERAIAAYEAALTVHTRAAFPEDWARTQNNLGAAYGNRIRGARADNLDRAIAAYEAALNVLTREAFPEDWASIQNNLGSAYINRIRGARADNIERAIAACEAALTVHTRTAFPESWAMTQTNLGVAYDNRIRGERADNLERAIAAHEAALTVYTRDTFPERWATVQTNLGAVYSNRIRGARADNIERAIAAYQAALTVYTRDSFPEDWATTQNNLGVAYSERIRGAREDNLERAIAAHQAALTVYTRDGFPEQWAETQNNLCVSYRNRIRGERADNLERAIAACEAALTVYSRDAFPEQWAMTQTNLGAAYAYRIRGARADNLERAIAAYQAALTVRTRDAFPEQWAETQTNLGAAYADRIRGERADNLEHTIEAFEAVLTVYTRDASPERWAMAQTNLGAAYAERIQGERADNLDRAIEAYEAALTVYTRDAFPEGWARTQNNLGVAYAGRIRGERANNLETAVAAYEAALSVYTRDDLPRDHIRTSQVLGDALLARGDWGAARQAYGDAIATVHVLAGDGLDDAEIQGLIDAAGPLFAKAAFVEAQNGDGWRALAILEDGRAQLFKAALRLNALSLSEDERGQLVALRGRVRELNALLEQRNGDAQGTMARGLDRGAILEDIAALNRQIRALVTRGRPAEETVPVMTLARSLLPAGGALVVPIVSDPGTALVVVAGAGEDMAATVHALPALTEASRRALLFGPTDDQARGGWLRSYLAAFGPGARVSPEESDNWQRQVADTADELWTVIGRDLTAALAARSVADGARVLWMPPGLMAVVPIGLARDGETGRYLLDRYEIATLPSLRLHAAAPAGPPSLTALVNPTGDLRFAAAEGALVASRFPAAARTVLGREEATAADPVLAALAGRSHWHLASHGRFSWLDPESSGIFLAGGAMLSLRDLLADLGQASPRLVVLSACESGLSDVGPHRHDEYFGLPMALLAGGAQAVVGTHWPVDDLATMFLIARFYELHLGPAGQPPAAALRQAQLWLRDAPRYNVARLHHPGGPGGPPAAARRRHGEPDGAGYGRKR